MRLGCELVAGQLIDFRTRKATRFRFAQPFGQVQQRLVVLGFVGIGRAELVLAVRRQWEHGSGKVAQLMNSTRDICIFIYVDYLQEIQQNP